MPYTGQLTRRSMLQASASVAVLAALGACAEAQTTRPNVVLILTDDLRADALSSSGPGYVRTPHIDALAKQSTVFPDAFVTTSICATSRASILTGEYARQHDFWWRSGDDASPIIENSFTSRLQDVGYETAYFGKWGIGRDLPPDNLFDASDLVRGNEPYTKPERQTHLTRHLADRAVDYIGRPKAKPFCLVVATKAPHAVDGAVRQFPPDAAFDSLNRSNTLPLPPSVSEDAYENLPSFLKDSEGRVRWEQRFGTPEKAQQTRRDYFNLVRGIDDAVGRIVEALKASGQYDDTLFIFTSDNGMMLGEHGLSGKWWIFEESIAVPLIVKLPASETRGLNDDTLALNIDIHPTILDVCKLETGPRVQGRSLLDRENRNAFFYEHLFEWGPVDIPKSEGIRTRQFSYAVYPEETGEREVLYDLLNDPYQLENVIGHSSYGSTAADLREQFAQIRSTVVTS